MKNASFLFEIVAWIAGILAAWLWYKASTIPLPSYETATVQAYEVGLYTGIQQASSLNAKAALLTAIAVFFSTVSGVLGACS